MEVEPSTLSQQLGILRRAGIVRQQRLGGEVRYSLMIPSVSELLAAARTTLGFLLADQALLQADLDEEASADVVGIA
jgi:ArsR family transcriptional regulator